MNKRKALLLLGVGCFLLLAAEAGAFTLTSPAFSDGQRMPANSGYRHGNVSPALAWSGFPQKTASFALVMDDPDARGWTHWLVFNIPASVTDLEGGFPNAEELPDGTRQGRNDFGKIGYGGPSPPSGTHRYVFRLFALDAKIDLDPGCSKSTLLKAIQGHVLSEASLTGLYGK
ncbi:MAG: YbhB/YbcL family Raf kinase inhibitor-like protein [Synergistaceae bacterium]|jgi:Raf kinase inhibitor-like YbhB/YbcL family protein|nr:YbhB/YbcL family Raf kinase inhibitor-like protein [Synergistaceae bacterium]